LIKSDEDNDNDEHEHEESKKVRNNHYQSEPDSEMIDVSSNLD
jgi:hypothetical protein